MKRPDGRTVGRSDGVMRIGILTVSDMGAQGRRADGSGKKQITRLDGASFAPSFFPDGQRIIFASNYQSRGSSQFELYSVGRKGKNLERITFAGGFNAFPVFSPDGKMLVFASNRNAKQPHEINIFVAWWVP